MAWGPVFEYGIDMRVDRPKACFGGKRIQNRIVHLLRPRLRLVASPQTETAARSIPACISPRKYRENV